MITNTTSAFIRHELSSIHEAPHLTHKFKFIVTTILGTGIALCLFVIMDLLISNDETLPPVISKPKPVSVVFEPPKFNIVIKPAAIPEPPPAVQPPQMPKPQAVEASSLTPVIDIAPPQLSITGGDLLTATSGMSDTTARPIFRVEPQYPAKAAQKGIEGWVDLAFNVDELGQVVDIKIIDSQPKRIFNRAAKKALKRWKYKAKIANGKAIKSQGLAIRLDFTMAN